MPSGPSTMLAPKFVRVGVSANAFASNPSTQKLRHQQLLNCQ
jgi:hypothetical protein